MDRVLVINASGGTVDGASHDVAASGVQEEFRRHGTRVDVRVVAPAAFEGAVREAVATAEDIVYVGGGDGSISTAAGCFLGRNVSLGILPLGTLNHFAKDLGFSPDWRQAVGELVRGVPRLVDVGEVNGRVFINNCSLGAYPEAVLRREAIRRRGPHKWVAMTLAALIGFWRLRRIRFELTLPSGTSTWRTPFVLVSNNRYSGHVLADQLRPRLDEGRLWIYAARVKSRLDLLRLAWQSLTRSIDEAEGLETLAAEEITILPRKRLPVGVDGEVVHLASTLRLRIHPRALTVIAPAAGDSAPA